MSRSIDISDTHKEIVQAILREHLANSCRVWVFGSRATWLAKEYSDLDLAIESKDGSALPLTLMIAMETAFEDSLLPWKVDVVDLHSVSAEFRAAIERDKVLFSLGVGGEWKEIFLLDLYEIRSGLSKPAKDFGVGFPFLSFKDVFYNYFVPPKLTQLVQSTDKEQLNCSIKKGDIFLTRTSETMNELGMSCVALHDYPTATFNGFSKRLRPKITTQIIPEFVGYFLRSSKFRNEMMAFSSMSTRASLNNEMIGRIKIPTPPINEQKAIGYILKKIDDKIELNRQTNQTLEAMAQALFQSWFVDFDPVIDKALAAGNEIPEAFQAKASARQAMGDQRRALPEEVTALFPDAFVFTEEMGWVPEGWESKKLSNLLEIKYGKDHKKLGEGDIPVYGSGGLMRNAEKSLYTGESVLIPRKGTLSNILYVNEAFWTVDTMFYTIPKHPNIAKYAFYQLKGLDFASMNVGSAVPSMTTKVLNELSVILPNDRVLKKFDDILKTYFKKLLENINQNSNLINLRDTLLPKLISGELRIADVGEFLAEVGV